MGTKTHNEVSPPEIINPNQLNSKIAGFGPLFFYLLSYQSLDKSTKVGYTCHHDRNDFAPAQNDLPGGVAQELVAPRLFYYSPNSS
jgi:hypothetical protein